MYYNYVLLCIDNKRKRQKLYIGTTSNLEQRLFQHKSKNIKTTRSFNKLKLVYCEICLNKTDALHREKQLKTGFGRGYIKRRLNNYFKNLRV